MLVTVFFEDALGQMSFSGKRVTFPFHDFVVQMVLDDLAKVIPASPQTPGDVEQREPAPSLELKQVLKFYKPIPLKGAGSLLATLNERTDRSSQSGPVLCVVDDDRIRDTLRLAHNACRGIITQEIQMRADNRLNAVVLLEGNMEYVQRAAADVFSLGSEYRRKSINIRDVVFKRAAYSSSLDQRNEIRYQSEALDRLVREYGNALKLLTDQEGKCRGFVCGISSL